MLAVAELFLSHTEVVFQKIELTDSYFLDFKDLKRALVSTNGARNSSL
jgi:hypothetical protein